MNTLMTKLLAYYVTSILMGIAMIVMGVYAFVTVYGWATFFAMIAVAIVLQIWFYVTMYFEGKKIESGELDAAVVRQQRGE